MATTILPAWYDPREEHISDMLPCLRFLCCVQRFPHRGEHCPGIAEAVNRMGSLRERPPESHTNIDYMIDFLTVSAYMPAQFNRAVGSIARACMPGNADPPYWHTLQTICYLEQRHELDWTTRKARQQQFAAWIGPSLLCAEKCGAKPQVIRGVLRVICFAPEVADVPLDFAELARTVRARYDCWRKIKEPQAGDQWDDDD